MDAVPAASDLGWARRAVTVAFGANGLLIASLAVRTPSLEQDLHLDAGRLGLAAALFGVAAVVAMQAAGGLAARFGSGVIVRAATVALPLLLVGVGLAPDFRDLLVLQVVFGAVHGMLDVGMNAHAVAVERAVGRHIINGCHAAWSIGAVLGGLLGSGAAQVGMTRAAHYAVVATALVPLALATGRFLLPAGVDRTVGRTAAGMPAGRARSGWRRGWSRHVLIFGAMGATVLTAEAAAANWSGVFLHEHRRASLGVAALGYVAFAGCQTALRLVGDRLHARWSAAALLRSGPLTAAAGMAIVVLSPSAWLAVAGYAVAGLGLATALPVLFGVVGHLGVERAGGNAGAAAAVARFTTMTYTGILAGPAVIGWVAQHAGLSWTLAALIPLLLAVAGGARLADAPPTAGGRQNHQPPPTQLQSAGPDPAHQPLVPGR